MKKAFLIFACAVLVASCSSFDNSSSKKDTLVTINKTEITKCKLYDDGYYHNGVDFEDSELCGSAVDFYNEIITTYKPGDDDTKSSVWNSQTLGAGGDIIIHLDNCPEIFFNSRLGDYVMIGDDLYKTENGEAEKFREKISSYMQEHKTADSLLTED